MTGFVPAENGVRVRLSTPEIAILSRVPELLGSVGADADDPAARRLHPPAYRDGGPAADELHRLTKDDVAEARHADIEVFRRGLDEADNGVELSVPDAEAWIRVLGGARIVLASRRGLFEVGDLASVSSDDPDVALVNLLGAYQQALSEVLLAGMGPQ